tara:strand:+ start:2372 stop:2905 length:534 start_codon:yes stop_codon:yes gene_type:complete
MAGNYNMEDDKWNKNKAKVELYLESHDLGDMEAVIRWNLNQGDNDPDNRKRFWTSITTLFGMLPDSPISRGRESSLPDEIQQAITTISVTYANAFAVTFASQALFGEIVRKHGKSGGGTYANEDEYRDSLQNAMKGRLTTYYRNHLKGVTNQPSWDGSMNGEIPNIVDATQASEEEE